MSVATALDPEAALRDWRRLLGVSFHETRLPCDWKPWREPRPALPIDEQITRLIEQRKIRSDVAGDFCPYARARRALFYAGLRAAQASDDMTGRKLDVERLRAAKKGLPKLGSEIERSIQFLAALQSLDGAEGQDEGLAIKDLLDVLLVSLERLKRGRSAIEARHVDLSQNCGNASRIAFAETMGGCWSLLTGRPLSVSDALEELLSAGWVTLFPDSSDISWTSAIRTAAARLQF